MKFYSTQKGFTLVEIIVSIAIFVLVATVALGALLKIIDANKKSQSIKTAINSVNFALESISRELRVGSLYVCDAGSHISEDPSSLTVDTTFTTSMPCDTVVSGGPWVLKFKSSKTATSGSTVCNLIYAYYFNGFGLYKAEQTECGGTLTFYPIISPSNTTGTVREQTVVDFGATSLKVVTNDPGNPGEVVYAPYVQIHLSGVAGVTGSSIKRKNETPFDMQTTITQRIPD